MPGGSTLLKTWDRTFSNPTPTSDSQLAFLARTVLSSAQTEPAQLFLFMATAEHLALLQQGVAIWMNGGTRIERSCRTLSKSDLRKADLSGANLYGDVSGGERRSVPRRGESRYANLSKAELRGQPEGAYLSNAHLHGANLSQANLVAAFLEGASLTEANLVGADLQPAGFLTEFNRTFYTIVDPALPDPGPPTPRHVGYRVVSCRGADFSKASLSKARLYGADLRHTKIIRADLTETELTEADLTQADLTEANLTENGEIRAFFSVGDFAIDANSSSVEWLCQSSKLAALMAALAPATYTRLVEGRRFSRDCSKSLTTWLIGLACALTRCSLFSSLSRSPKSKIVMGAKWFVFTTCAQSLSRKNITF